MEIAKKNVQKYKTKSKLQIARNKNNLQAITLTKKIQ